MYSETEIKNAMRNIILCQCLGLTAGMMFSNNFILSYLKDLGCEAADISIMTSVPSIVHMTLGIPLAFFADKIGKRKLGTIGCFILACSFFLLWGAGFTEHYLLLIWPFFFIFALGSVMFSCTWFGLLSPIIPADIRGRFFGRLRISWQLVGIVLTYIITETLDYFPGRSTFQTIMLVLTGFLFARIIPYRAIPEKRDPEQNNASEPLNLKVALSEMRHHPRFLKYCFYRMTLGFVSAKVIMMIGLLQKEVLELPDNEVVFTGLITFVGNLAGYFLGGKLADKIGNHKLFSHSQLGFTIMLFLIPLRAFSNDPIWVIATCAFMFGLFTASFGIASTSEMFALIPTRCRALSTTFAGLSATLGGVVASVLLSIALKQHIYPVELVSAKGDFRYDFFILICAVLSTAILLAYKFTRLFNFHISDTEQKQTNS